MTKDENDGRGADNRSPASACPVCGLVLDGPTGMTKHSRYCSPELAAKARGLVGLPVRTDIPGATPGIAVSAEGSRVTVRYATRREECIWDHAMVPVVLWTRQLYALNVHAIPEEEYDAAMSEMTDEVLRSMRRYLLRGIIDDDPNDLTKR